MRTAVVTLDGLHSNRDTEWAILGMHGADYVLAIKPDCPATFAELAAIDWDGPDVRRHAEEPVKAHGPEGLLA